MHKMNKCKIKKYIVKSIVLLFFLVKLNIRASSVDENDLSAFITRNEFENLKNVFYDQINTYSINADSRVDEAIAGYLAGVNLTVDVDSIINRINQKFVGVWDVETSRLGSASKYYINIGMMAGNGAYGLSMTQLQNETGAINAPAWKYDNCTSDDYKALYYYGSLYKDDKDDDDFDVPSEDRDRRFHITKYILYTPVSTAAGTFVSSTWEHVISSAYDTPNWYGKNEKAESTDEAVRKTANFGIVEMDYSCNLGGYNASWPVSLCFSAEDEYNDYIINKVPGVKLPTSKIYFIEDININRLGTRRESKKPNYSGNELRGTPYSSGKATAYKSWGSTNHKNYTYLYIYNHKYKELYWDRAVNTTVTNILGEPILYYQGLPLFKGSKNSDIRIKLKFENSASADTIFVVQKDKFEDTDLPITGVTNYTNPEVAMKAMNNQEVELMLKDVKINDVYWIKARPINGETKITTTLINTI